jgi:predicted MFS family arabinose efflux permease
MAHLHTSIVATGQLVTVFALAYAFSSPMLTALTGAFHRRNLMILSLSAFTLANIIASVAPNYWELMAARILLAAAAGLYVPGANALAGAIAGPERRGTALGIVNGGISIAVAFGVPLGALVGDRLGWRMTFAGVAALSAAATAGLLFGLPRAIGAGLSTATLRERIHTARKPVILTTLIITTVGHGRLHDLHLPGAIRCPNHATAGRANRLRIVHLRRCGGRWRVHRRRSCGPPWFAPSDHSLPRGIDPGFLAAIG